MAQAISRSVSQLAKPNLLLSFDAFGTLFRPKDTIPRQYFEEAQQHGLTGFSVEMLARTLLVAMVEEGEANPNYGKATGLGATKWWTNIIQRAFAQYLPKDASLPPALAPRLIERFATKEAYKAEDSLVSSFKSLRQQPSAHQKYNKIVIGIVTNSDDRVPSILSSFGLDVSPLRYGATSAEATKEQHYDIDFHCMSYDVGIEKPDKQMFQSAEAMLTRIIAAREGKEPTEAELAGWQRVHVGDDFAKDAVGANDAGWDAVLLDVEGKYNEMTDLKDCAQKRLGDVFGEQRVVRAGSIAALAAWLTGQENR